ncbi:TlpA family protein disulfide reductase [Mucilaginibacter paludis]|uniref:Redoxin domain protein n=1 Tax=Mucilaginibacter paludis DSM 18603 TaxID=714943 RepID=H1YIK3_9SPHI|nr:TlpA disulfide reductase family protein [Mucilaginibacter paludis]EHQ26569.1 redoxin domain protein [Mucilaginibacter paludis DSM 18603]
MQKTLLIIVLAALCLNFNANSQRRDNIIKPLSIGDTISENIWKAPLNIINELTGKKTITLNDYHNKKLIILDFWATHCVPCIKSLYRLDTLQDLFNQDVLILPVTYESSTKVKPFILKRGWKLPSVVNDSILKAYFPHIVVPHQVWIRDGKVISITSGEEATANHIQGAIDNTDIALHYKRDIAFNPTEPITKYLQETKSSLNTNSILTGYVDGLGGTGVTTNDSMRICYFLNRTLLSIYKEANQINYNRIQLDMVKADDVVNRNYDKRLLYCYQLFMSSNKTEEDFREKITNDLDDYFKLLSRFDKHIVDCYVIRQANTSTNPNLLKASDLSSDNNGLPFSQIIDVLNYTSKWSPLQPIFIAEVAQNIVFNNTNLNEIKAMQNDIESLSTWLKRHNLTIKKEARELTMLVISKNTFRQQ